MRRSKWILVVAALAVLAVMPVAVAAQDPARGIFVNPSSQFQVQIWPDRGPGSTYYPGENMEIYFRATRGCYVYILNIDTSGVLRWILPNIYSSNNYLPANTTRKIPDGAYFLTVAGPAGTEWLMIFATLQPVDMPYLEQAVRSREFAPGISGDRDQVLQDIRTRGLYVIPTASWAFASVSFNVGGITPPLPPPPPPVVPRVGSVSVSSDPVGATIFLDGVSRGTTPARLDNVPYGNHEVVLLRSGYYCGTQRFTLASNIYYVRKTLEPIPAASQPPSSGRVVLNQTITLNDTNDYFQRRFSHAGWSGTVEVRPVSSWDGRLNEVYGTFALNGQPATEVFRINAGSSVYRGQKWSESVGPFVVEVTLLNFELQSGFFTSYFQYLTFSVTVTYTG